MTAKNPFDRFEDGRPRVPEALLRELKKLSAEDIWEGLYHANYHNQFAGDWIILNAETKLIGRAVTAQFMPLRPDVDEVIRKRVALYGPQGAANQQIIDRLRTSDVPVIDLFGKREGGTFVGDVLATAIRISTNTGMVVNGAVRDLNGIRELKMCSYVRSCHPTPLHEVLLLGVNIPIKIGMTTVLPGDVVFGDREGVCFIPPEMVGRIIERARMRTIRDTWTKTKLATTKHKSSALYPEPQGPVLKRDYALALKRTTRK